MKLMLASTSKFKSEILSKVHLNHECVKSNFVEELDNRDDVYEYVKALSLGKASNAICDKNDNIIIGLDTVVYINGKVMEKPKSIEEAKENILLTMGKTSEVVTGITIINNNTKEIITDYQITKISLRKIKEEDINYYLENEKGIMHASGYIIETILSNFIEKIDGSYYNILGIPVEKIYYYLEKMGYSLKDLQKNNL